LGNGLNEHISNKASGVPNMNNGAKEARNGELTGKTRRKRKRGSQSECSDKKKRTMPVQGALSICTREA